MAHRTPPHLSALIAAVVVSHGCDAAVTGPTTFAAPVRLAQIAGAWHGTRAKDWDSVNDDGCRTSVEATFTQTGTIVQGRIADGAPSACPPDVAVEFDGTIQPPWIYLTSRQQPTVGPALGQVVGDRLVIDWLGSRWTLVR